MLTARICELLNPCERRYAVAQLADENVELSRKTLNILEGTPDADVAFACYVRCIVDRANVEVDALRENEEGSANDLLGQRYTEIQQVGWRILF